MPVRIIFRGLVLFRIEKEGWPEGRIVAQLIEDKSMSGAMPSSMSAHAHQAEIQILTGKQGQSLVPVPLARDVDVTFTAAGPEYVSRAPSYSQYVPKLGDIAGQRFTRTDPVMQDPRFIRNLIFVNRGTIRAKDLVTWDAGGYPLDGSAGTGTSVVAPVDVQFMFSDWAGAVASECIIDIEEATRLSVSSTDGVFTNPDLHAEPTASHDDQHVPPDTVEILVTNLPPQRRKPVPWSVHYQWLFRAAGYTPGPIDPNEVAAFRNEARAYAKIRSKIDPTAPPTDAFNFDAEDLPFLAGPTALPFPYLAMPPVSGGGSGGGAVEAMSVPATDPWNRPLCPQGDE